MANQNHARTESGHLGFELPLKRIELRAQNKEEAESIATHFSLKQVVASALAARGFKADDSLRHFLSPSLKDGLPSPQKLLNLDKACALIKECVESNGKIAICSDFDVDGLSGAAQVVAFFRAINVECESYVPDRFKDGYGLHNSMIDTACEVGCSLLITIDFGTKNKAEIAYARGKGLKTIVIDHHHVGDEDPGADVFINPQQSSCGFAEGTLSAAGLAWYLIVGLRASLPTAAHTDPKDYLDLACLGTICDMVPLRGANRVIARRGLELLSKTERPGLQAMKQASSLNGATKGYDVSFRLGPQINAAGRLAHGEVVINLLTATSMKKALPLAKKLARFNTARQDIEKRVKSLAEERVLKNTELPAGIVVWDKEFHTGVIGIVAQRLTEKFYRPAAVLGMDAEGIFKGSVRGIKGFSVVDALESLSSLLLKYGGHTGAGGFSIKEADLEEFHRGFAQESLRQLLPEQFCPYVVADTEIDFGELSYDLSEQIKQFAPFGIGNPAPIFLARGVKVADVKELKGGHLKVAFIGERGAIAGLFWRQTSHPALFSGAVVDVAFKLDTNTFRGFTELQASIQAVELVS
jgi:single-stranded-DNA-specific exonuclease